MSRRNNRHQEPMTPNTATGMHLPANGTAIISQASTEAPDVRVSSTISVADASSDTPEPPAPRKPVITDAVWYWHPNSRLNGLETQPRAAMVVAVLTPQLGKIDGLLEIEPVSLVTFPFGNVVPVDRSSRSDVPKAGCWMWPTMEDA